MLTAVYLFVLPFQAQKGVTAMSKKATEFQKKEMSKMYRGKEIFKPLNTGWIDENARAAPPS